MLQALALDPVLHAAVYRGEITPQTTSKSFCTILSTSVAAFRTTRSRVKGSRPYKQSKIFRSCASTQESNSPPLGLLSYDTQPWSREKAVQAQNHIYDESKDNIPFYHYYMKLKLKA